jgi:RNA polymerase-binding transcription factor DksA
MIQPNPLSPEQIDRFRTALLDERWKVRESLERLHSDAARSTPESRGETTARTHLADLGSELHEQEEDLGLAEKFGRSIGEIDLALERIEEGSYGVCEACGSSIPVERLEAIPSAACCARCQWLREQGLEEAS